MTVVEPRLEGSAYPPVAQFGESLVGSPTVRLNF